MARPHAIGAALTGILMLAPAAFAAEAIRVEVRPGVKDHDLLRRFIAAAKEAV